MSYTYDSIDRLSTVVDHRLTGNQTTTYTYDPASNLVTVAYPNGLVSTLSYDSVNRLTGLATVNGANSPVAGYDYNPLGATGIKTQAGEVSLATIPSGRETGLMYEC